MAMARFWELGLLATFHALTPGRIGYILHKKSALVGSIADCYLPKTGKTHAEIAEGEIILNGSGFGEQYRKGY